MSNPFHLAIPAGDLEKTIPFYTDILGCELGPKEENKWQDIDFWGNGLTLHTTVPRTQREDDRNRERHEVDMWTVCVPHFGIHLEKDKFQFVKKQIEKTIGFFDNPYVRFSGKDTEQETFFIEDPNFNVLEIKTLLKTD